MPFLCSPSQDNSMEIIFEENGDLTAIAAVTGGSAAISTGIAEL